MSHRCIAALRAAMKKGSLESAQLRLIFVQSVEAAYRLKILSFSRLFSV